MGIDQSYQFCQVQFPLMPLGVEHAVIQEAMNPLAIVQFPLMPLGVEHL